MEFATLWYIFAQNQPIGLFVDVEFKYPKYDPRWADHFLASIKFSKKELVSYGVPQDSIELEDPYINLCEFDKIRRLWTNPMYVADFFDDNETHLQDPFWRGIDKDRFINDILSSTPYIFREIATACQNGKIDELFKPLDKSDEDKESHTSIRVKHKQGKIGGRFAFRIYAIKIEDGCYVVTGGAIKVVKEMHQAKNTTIELNKINAAYNKYLGKNSRAEFVEFVID